MAISETASLEPIETKSQKELNYLELKDKVVDITKDTKVGLNTLKSELKLNTETELDAALAQLNLNVDKLVSGFISTSWTDKVEITVNGAKKTDTVKNIIASKDKDELDALAELALEKTGYTAALDTLKDTEIKTTLTDYKFELKDLRDDVQDTSTKTTKTETTKTSKTDASKNADDTYEKDNTYKYTPDKFSLTELGTAGKILYDYDDVDDKMYTNPDLLNVFKKGGLDKYIDKILETTGGLSDREYKINLSPEHGLAGLISYVDTNNLRDKIDSAKDIKKLANGKPGFEYDRAGGLDHEKAKLAEIIKTANDSPDFKKALIAFADDAKAYGANYEKRFKQEINFKASTLSDDNVLEALCDFNGDGLLATDLYQYKQRKAHKEAWKKEHTPLPYNRRKLWKKDWSADKEAEKEENKKTRKAGIENLGDVGTIFGPELYDAIQTAENVLDVRIKYKDANILALYPDATKGENIVIYNILQEIQGFDQNADVNTELEKLTVADCSTAKLKTLCETYPSFQPLFAKAIETMNGSSSVLAPDLVDTLSGVVRLNEGTTGTKNIKNSKSKTYQSQYEKDAAGDEGTIDGTTDGTKDVESKPYLSQYEKDAAIDKTIIDAKDTNPVVKDFIDANGDDGILYMRRGIMSLLNGVNISATLNDAGKLTALGISKSRDTKRQEHELTNSFAKDLLGVGVIADLSFDKPTAGLMLTWGKEDMTKNLKNKYSGNADFSATVGAMTGIAIDVGGTYTHQFNYPSIVTSSLDDLSSAHYLGVHYGLSGALAVGYKGDFKSKNLKLNDMSELKKLKLKDFTGNVKAGVEGGLLYQSDKKAAIEQMYRQYNSVTSILFDLSGKDAETGLTAAKASDVADKNSIEKFLLARKDTLYKSLSTSTKEKNNLMAEFMENNDTFLETDIKQLAAYFDAMGIFKAIAAGATDKVAATKEILNVFEDGLTNEWRESMYENMAGTTQISSVGVGLKMGLNFREIVKSLKSRDAFKTGLKTLKLSAATKLISLGITHRRNDYINVAGQKKLDASLIGTGAIDEKKDTFTPDFTEIKDPKERLTAYADYIKAIYNFGKVKNADGTKKTDPETDVLETGTDANGYLYLKYNGSAVNAITDIIDVRAKIRDAVLDNIKISADKKTLTLGDVGKMTAYTQADGEGKRCFLILGGESTTNTKRIGSSDTDFLNHTGTPKKSVTFTEIAGSYKALDYAAIKAVTDAFVKRVDDKTGAKLVEAQTNTLQFFATDGTLQNPNITGITIVDTDKLIGTKLTTGTLNIEKSKDGKTYTLTHLATPATKLDINYNDLSDVIDYADTNNFITTEYPFSVTNKFFDIADTSFSEMNEAQKTVTKLETKLYDLEREKTSYKSKDAYLKFMTYISNVDVTDVADKLISDVEITESITELEDSTMLGGADFKELLTILTDKDKSMMTKAWVLDELKTIFAFQAEYPGKTLSAIVAPRLNYFTTLYGPSEVKLNSALQTELLADRTAILKEYGSQKFDADPSVKNNLIGYTAFYRPGLDAKNTNQRFSMTGIGETSCQGEPVEITTNASEARTWFTDNLEKNKYEMDILIAAIENKTAIKLTTGQLKSALSSSGKEIFLDNGQKISIKSSCMFYLAGQCANESIGLQIDSITATKLNVIINNNGTYGGYTAEGTPIQKLSSSTTIAGRNLSSAMKVGSYAETLGINAGIVPTERIGTPLPEAQDTSTTQAGIDGVGDSSGTIANIE